MGFKPDSNYDNLATPEKKTMSMQKESTIIAHGFVMSPYGHAKDCTHWSPQEHGPTLASHNPNSLHGS